MVSEIVRILRFTDLIISSLVAAPPSVIGIGDDHANLSTEKDQYDHVMSPFHRRFIPLLSLCTTPSRFLEDENAAALPPIDPYERPTNEQNDNQMDVDGVNQGLEHIPGVDETTLLSNASEEFVLPPITTAQTPAARQAIKRKRKLIVDETKEIDSLAMKLQLSDTTDIVGVLELAPPTRRLMHLKETGGIEKLFSSSATSIFSKTLQQVMENSADLFLLSKFFSSSSADI